MSVNFAALSLVNQQQLLTKIYFPRMFVPTSAIGAGLVDFAISAAVFAVVMAIYMQPPAWTIVLVPVLLLFTVMAALGFGYLLAALTVAYRDFRYVIPFMLQGMMFISPVIWPVTIVPEQWRWVVALNPMTGIIEGYRSAILGMEWDFLTLGVSAVTTVVLFLYGMAYFRKTERRFADIA